MNDNYIEKRHLGDKLKRSLRFSDNKIGFDDIESDIVKILKSNSTSSTAYDDKELRNRIIALEKNSETKINAVNTYASKTDAISVTTVEDKINKAIDALKKELTPEIDKRLDGSKNYIIDEAMLDTNLQYKINARYNNLYNNTASGDTKDYTEEIKALEVKINANKENITNLAFQVSNPSDITESMLSSGLKDKINNPINDGTLTLNKFALSDRAALEAAINSDTATVSIAINKINSQINSPREHREVLFCSTDSTSSTATAEWGYIMLGAAISTKDKSLYDAISTAFNSNKTSYTADNGVVIDLTEYDYLIYLNESSAEYMALDDNGKFVKQTKNPLSVFEGSFAFDPINNILYYITDTDSVQEVVKGQSTTQAIELTIAANSSVTQALANADKSAYKVLLKDNDANSRTYGKYINSEAIITVAYDENNIYVYNDSDEPQTVNIYYQ